MGFITVGDENSTPIELYYEDQGPVQPIVLIHGYPAQRPQLGAPDARAARRRIPRHHLRPPRVRRVVQGRHRLRLRHVRRRPPRPAGDPRPSRRRPRRLLDGHRRARPLRLAARPRAGREARVPRLARAVPPRPRRQPRRCAAGGLRRHRGSSARTTATPGTREFFANFYNLDENLGQRISQEAVTASWNVAVSSAPVAAHAVVSVVDRGLPRRRRRGPRQRQARAHPARHRGQHPAHRRHRPTLPPRSCRTPTYVEIEGAPHGLLWTHADDVNAALLAFLG